jgi:cephalosporin hydroxylase
LDATKDLPIKVNYEWKNDLDLVLPASVDMVFIDTWHVYGHLKRELAKFSKVTKKYIAMHDTTVDDVYGETIRMGFNAKQQSQDSGYPIEEINCGLWKAIEEFLATNPEWRLKERFTNNNGLTILERV